MTEKEAIKELSYDETAYGGKCTSEVREIAIQALEKQIPKKPLFGTVRNDTTYHCGSCKKFIGFYDTRIYEYCHNCGQKLDWQTKL